MNDISYEEKILFPTSSPINYLTAQDVATVISLFKREEVPINRSSSYIITKNKRKWHDMLGTHRRGIFTQNLERIITCSVGNASYEKNDELYMRLLLHQYARKHQYTEQEEYGIECRLLYNELARQSVEAIRATIIVYLKDRTAEIEAASEAKR
jgi:hypothetical protein